MTSIEFTHWLRGFIEATAGYAPNQAQWQTVAAKLNEVTKPNTLDSLKKECDKRDAAQANPVKTAAANPWFDAQTKTWHYPGTMGFAFTTDSGAAR